MCVWVCVYVCALVPAKDRPAFAVGDNGNADHLFAIASPHKRWKWLLCFLHSCLASKFRMDGKKSGERVKGDMWDGERRFLGVSARGTEPSEDPKPLVSFCWRDEALTLIEAHQCACLCERERVHSKIHFTKITSQSVWPPICRLLLVPYLFLFHLLRIKECNPVEIGQHNGVSNKRKCLSMIFRLCVRGCVSDLGRTSRTWFDPWQLAAPLSVC